jgi:Flp pilus assembly protein TadG
VFKAIQGTTAIEFALIAPSLFLLVIGAIEFGRLMLTQASLHFAVESASRCAAITPGTCGTASQIATYAAGTISELNIPASAFTSSTPSCGHQVNASFTYQFVATGLFTMTPTLTAQSCFP